MFRICGQTFLKSVTIRGIGKLNNAKTRFHRGIWIAFLLLMSSLLAYSIVLLVFEYLRYTTIVQHHQILPRTPPAFPSLSVCNLRVFGERAARLWNNGSVMTPTQFNQILRRKMAAYLDNGQYMRGVQHVYQDRVSQYYQVLRVNESLAIGMQREATFQYCVIRYATYDNANKKTRCDFRVTTFSTPEYFNCFTISFEREATSVMNAIIVLKSDESDARIKAMLRQHQRAFISGIFDHAKGFRGVVHEPGSYPNLDRDGFNMEPGRFVEIKYRSVQVRRVSTPINECINQNSSITDLTNAYTYSQEACIRSELGKRSLRQCKCYYTSYLRPGLPNSTHPYCGNIRKKIDVNCLIQFSKAYNIRRQIQMRQNECKPRCSRMRYDIQISQTVWNPTSWQMHWLFDQNTAWDELINHARNSTEFAAAKKRVQVYLRNKDISSFVPNPRLEDQNYQYIKLSRESLELEVSTEKLQLDINAMMSRIGGLCSLFLGLTCSFIIELVEVVYLSIVERRNPKPPPPNSSSDKKRESLDTLEPNTRHQHDQHDYQQRCNGWCTQKGSSHSRHLINSNPNPSLHQQQQHQLLKLPLSSNRDHCIDFNNIYNCANEPHRFNSDSLSCYRKSQQHPQHAKQPHIQPNSHLPNCYHDHNQPLHQPIQQPQHQFSHEKDAFINETTTDFSTRDVGFADRISNYSSHSDITDNNNHCVSLRISEI